MSELGHLAKRFFGSVRPGGPRPVDSAWAEENLLPGEVELWHRMSPIDRRHAVGVARRVEAALGPDTSRSALAAALLHDVGKVTSGLGTFGRVVATVLVKVAGRRRVGHWTERGGFARRVALYADHPRLGADLLESAGSDPMTIAWALEHHLPGDQWTVTPVVGAALKAADDD